MTNKKTIIAGVLVFILILVIGYFFKPNSSDYQDTSKANEKTIQKITVAEFKEMIPVISESISL